MPQLRLDVTTWNTSGQRQKSAEQRFSEKHTKGESCWLWQSAFSTRGYGVFYLSKDRPVVLAHRLALEKKLGRPIGQGMMAMHSCDNPACVNPDHLSEGSNSDNMMDASRKGRIARGERNGGGGKLTADQARAIYESKGVVGCVITARQYGVSSQTVKAIRSGKIWQSARGTL